MLFEYKELERRIREELNLTGRYHKDKALTIIDKRNEPFDFYIKSGMIFRIYTTEEIFDGTTRSFSDKRKSGDSTRFVTRALGYILMVDTIGSGRHQNEAIEISVFQDSDRINYLEDPIMRDSLSSWVVDEISSATRIEV